MTIGTFVVSAILVVIVAAIIINMIRSHRAGKHVGCDGCGACGAPGSIHNVSNSHKHHQGSCCCSNVESMIEKMNADLENTEKKRF